VGNLDVTDVALVALNSNCHAIARDTDGYFETLWPAGLLPVTARVRGEWSNSVDRMLLVPAVPGRTTQLGLFDFVPPGFGSVEFDVLYHGEPVPTGWTYQTRIGGLFP